MSPVVYHLDELGGHEFEEVMVDVFQRLGYLVERGPLSGDEGRDLIIRNNHITCVVECKHQKNAVGRPVIQKLHSAAITFPGATSAIAVCTCSFSDGAREYAQHLIDNHSFNIELWDYDRLFSEARQVNVFFAKEQEGTVPFFTVTGRPYHELKNRLWSTFLLPLSSCPRTTHKAIIITDFRRQLVPAMVVDYHVNKVFETNAGVIHRVSNSGRIIIEASSTTICPTERRYWATSSMELIDDAVFEGEPLAKYFEVLPSGAISHVRNYVSSQLSRSVNYRGGNNQHYTMYCEVGEKDISAVAMQFIFFRWQLTFQIGPRSYGIVVVDDASREPDISASKNLAETVNALIEQRAMICNDCGLIVPEAGKGKGIKCAVCQRTLCNTHVWWYPSRAPAFWIPKCSGCYIKSDHSKESLQPIPINSSLAILLSIVPGLPFLIGERVFLGFVGILGYLLLALGSVDNQNAKCR